MRNPGGYLVIEDPDPLKSRGEQHVRECDTITCNHCNGIVRVTPATDLCQCKKCMGFVCMPCVRTGGCQPFEERLNQYEEAIRRGIMKEHLLRTFGR